MFALTRNHRTLQKIGKVTIDSDLYCILPANDTNDDI
jgi:hypothetical protein